MDQTVRLTIREIAKEAGVSTQTVSRVINDRPDVAEHTRLRIQEIIDRTGYYPSPHARGLTLSQNKIIGVIATTPAEYGPAQSLAGLDQEAVRRGYTLSFILVHDETDIQPAIRKMRAQNVGGLIWSVTGQIGADFEAVARDLVALPFP
ncbi:MAG: LacI family DNA-binding transcriptional regulator, partial [Chloroflexota bacterium]